MFVYFIAQDVENFAKHRQQLGVPVHLVRFDEAEHVKLYTNSPQKYIQSVCKFVNDCLANEPNVTSNKKCE